MKKIITFILILMLAPVCYSYSLNGFTEQFARKFKTCEPYYEEVSFNANGRVFHDKKQITGWFGDYCGYKQTVRTSGVTLYAACAFTRSQVNTLYNALLIQPKVFGVDNKTQDIWDSYVLNPQNCKLSNKNLFKESTKLDKKYIPRF
ncbi:hypothetical protein IAC76_04395 [Spirochaetes bacterium]|uniref:Uncharacterized protein n=1 Tax=Candidatus Scatousia excrementipullorum TaxID=2840936 RepID=A0A9D9DPU4_9BACT|nr:hypothetical protein [Candidatus Scatousia excrementipullorum]